MSISFIYLLELIGTAAFAVSGALAASRKNMDIFGFGVLALMPAVGGGTIRDIIIGRTPVFWIDDNRYVTSRSLRHWSCSSPPTNRVEAPHPNLDGCDGTRSVRRTRHPDRLSYDTGALVAVMLGVMTAVMGGMIRDIICNEIPLVLSKEIYATAAFAASITFIVADNLDIGAQFSLVIAVAVGFVVRALAIIYNWSLPSFGAR